MERVKPTAWTGEGAVTATLVVCALAMTGLAGIRVFRETTRTRIIAIQPERRIPDGLRLADGQNILGSRSARVRVVIFSDYQCEGCALMNQLFADLRALHPGDIAVVHHHFPLTRVHVHAFAASVASECAGEQGRFPAMRDALFRRQADIGARP